jgi:hypothetical protein
MSNHGKRRNDLAGTVNVSGRQGEGGFGKCRRVWSAAEHIIRCHQTHGNFLHTVMGRALSVVVCNGRSMDTIIMTMLGPMVSAWLVLVHRVLRPTPPRLRLVHLKQKHRGPSEAEHHDARIHRERSIHL